MGTPVYIEVDASWDDESERPLVTLDFDCFEDSIVLTVEDTKSLRLMLYRAIRASDKAIAQREQLELTP